LLRRRSRGRWRPSQSSDKGESAISNVSSPEKNQNETSTQRADASPPSREIAHPSHSNNSGSVAQPKNDEKHWLEYATFFNSLVALLIAIMAASFAWYQGWVARDTEQRQLRAYILVDKASVVLNGTTLRTEFDIKNFGLTPAYNLFVRTRMQTDEGGVARLVGIEGGVVSEVINLESSGVGAPDWRPRHDEHYYEA
jgi:hypothetical protein